MNKRKNAPILIGLILSVSLLSASLTALLLTNYHKHAYIRLTGEIFQKIIDERPDTEPAILTALKKSRQKTADQTERNILQTYGYRPSDLLPSAGKYHIFFITIGSFASGIFFLAILFILHKKDISQIRSLSRYLEKVYTGDTGTLFPMSEDKFSKLQDEIYKIVTALRQTRETALKDRHNFAENLYNIAHQIKTPLTSISLSMQMMRKDPSPRHLEQIDRQLSRLTHLEGSLLLLSRIDSGTLALERKEVDVFTVLTLAADNLQGFFSNADVSIHIPEAESAAIWGDMEWTMEALMNLFKNCLEHTPPGGTVHCSYGQNPLYTQIRIWDEGSGFAKKDLPHLFERFYRGTDAAKDGIGIGLALSKMIVERQNGTISAGNLPDGGAYFEIHFYTYSH